MSRFDPRPGEPYSRCAKREFTGETKELAREHSLATGHSYYVTNPPRSEAIDRSVQMEADDAMDSAATEFCDGIYRLHTDEGVSLKELTEAVKFTDFSTQWAEYISGETDDEENEESGPVQLHQETALFDVDVVQS
jgi:hypothetical protein